MTVEPEAPEELCEECDEPLDLHCDDCDECHCDGSCIEDEEEEDEPA